MTINNEHKKLNFSNEREQSQTCLSSAEHEKNQGRKVLNVPNLRFKEFQGEWEKTKFGDIAIVVGGGTPDTNTSQYWNGKIQWFTPSEIGRNKYVYNSVRTISEEGLNKSSAKLLPIGTILLSSRATVGECSINKKECTTNQGFQSLIPKENISNEFVYYLIQTKRKDLIRKSCGSTFLEISANEVRKIVVSIPTIKEQDKIAKLLSLLDECIATQNKIIDKLLSLIKGIRNKLFENDKDWRKAKIREFLCIGNGKDYKHLDIGDIPVYGTGGKMLSVNDFLYDGDSVCIGRKGTIDTPLFLTGKFWTVDTLFYTYGFKDVLPKFCYYLFKQINWQLYNEGTGVPSLSKSTIENIKVRIPSIVQQYKICYILDSYEDKIKNEGLILDLYCSQKQYLLRQMFV